MWASHHWLLCALEWKGRRSEQWLPHRLTWLFFHDEAVAFAAGHRPCALCRRPAYNAFRQAWAQALGESPPAHDELDRTLHAQRLLPRRRQRRLHAAEFADLPDGAFILEREHPELVRGGRLITWTAEGYGEARRRPRGGPAQLLTPPSTLAVLQAGYPVQIADSAAR